MKDAQAPMSSNKNFIRGNEEMETMIPVRAT